MTETIDSAATDEALATLSGHAFNPSREVAIVEAELDHLREVARIATEYVAADAGDPQVAHLYDELAVAIGLDPDLNADEETS